MKKLLLSLGAVLLLTGVSASLAYAKPDDQDFDAIPEVDGTYNEPGHPGVKVRVFAHHEKLGRAEQSLLTCSLTDPDSTAVVGAAGWHLSPSVTYSLNPSSAPSASINLATIASNAFGDWRAATGNKVSFTRGSDTFVNRSAYDGRNVIAWGRTSGSALAVTYVRYLPSTGLAVDVDTIVNKKFAWSWSNSMLCADAASYDTENILTHELGHWLGLDDEYDAASYQDATMYGYGAKGEVKKSSPASGDQAGAYDIYN